MVLIGLLLIALVCLALGLVLASAVWLVGSLAASAAAAWVLWRGRDTVARAKGEAPAPDGTDAAPTEDAPAFALAGQAAAATGEPDGDRLADPEYARLRADALSAAGAGEAGPAPAGGPVAVATPQPAGDPEVWVIDGRPNYHTAHCGVLLGADAEAIPHTQAVEDGFTPCTLCDPDAYPAPAPAGDEAAPPSAEDAGPTVWVTDGWPHYHDADCPILAASGAPESVPFAQAVDDGFTPCPTCRATTAEPEPVAETEPEPGTETEPEPEAEPEPETAPEPAAEVEPEAATEAEPATDVPDVWVVAGRPRYHREDCMIVADQGAVAVPLTQATEEGFKPCSLCEPPA